MKKIYPFFPPIEITDYDKKDPIDMSSLPAWVKKEMEKVAKIEKCDIRELTCVREISYDLGRVGWVDSPKIILEKK